jgi:hypothetical protein
MRNKISKTEKECEIVFTLQANKYLKKLFLTSKAEYFKPLMRTEITLKP